MMKERRCDGVMTSSFCTIVSFEGWEREGEEDEMMMSSQEDGEMWMR